MNTYAAHHVPGGVAHQRHRCRERQRTAVPMPVDEFPGPGVVAPEVVIELGPRRVHELRLEEIMERTPDGLRRAPAIEPCGGLVPTQDTQLRIGGDHGFGEAIQQAGMEAQHFRGRFHSVVFVNIGGDVHILEPDLPGFCFGGNLVLREVAHLSADSDAD